MEMNWPDYLKKIYALDSFSLSESVGPEVAKKFYEDRKLILKLTEHCMELREALNFYAYEIDWMHLDIKSGQELRSKARAALEKEVE